MIIEEMMNTDVITVSPEHTIMDASTIMNMNKIKHLPIVDQKRQLVGIISDRDIRDASPSILISQIDQRELLDQPINSIMKTDVITGHPLDFVEEVGPIFCKHKISCLPIVNGKTLVGIITKTDLLHTLIELTGVEQPGSHIEVKVPNRPGVLIEMMSTFQNMKTNILSVLIYPHKKDERYKIIVLRVQTINPTNLIVELEQAGYEVLWPNLPGM